MKQRFGGLLSLALGLVLLVGGGLDASTSGAVGDVAPTCQPFAQVGVDVNSCPTDEVTVAELTEAVTPVARTRATPTAPSDWSMTLTSTNCSAPQPTGQFVDQPVSVPNNGNTSAGSFFVFADPRHVTKCSYTLTEQAVSGFTTTYSTSSPFTLPYNSQGNGSFTITVTNSYRAATPSSSPPVSSSAPVSSSVPLSSSPPVSTSAAPSTSPVSASAVSSSTAPVLASTGPRTGVTGTLVAGVLLCLLGVVLLLGGRARRTVSRHRG